MGLVKDLNLAHYTKLGKDNVIAKSDEISLIKTFLQSCNLYNKSLK